MHFLKISIIKYWNNKRTISISPLLWFTSSERFILLLCSVQHAGVAYTRLFSPIKCTFHSQSSELLLFLLFNFIYRLSWEWANNVIMWEHSVGCNSDWYLSVLYLFMFSLFSCHMAEAILTLKSHVLCIHFQLYTHCVCLLNAKKKTKKQK